MLPGYDVCHADYFAGCFAFRHAAAMSFLVVLLTREYIRAVADAADAITRGAPRHTLRCLQEATRFASTLLPAMILRYAPRYYCCYAAAADAAAPCCHGASAP